jgi:hypothetical protein
MIFEDLKTAIGDWLGKDYNQLNDTIRGQIINIAQRDLLRSYDLRFGELAYALTTAGSDQEYNVPDGYSRTYSMWYMSGADKVDIIPLTKEEFDKKFEDNTTTGAPTHYTIWANKLYLGPMPDAIYNVKWNVRVMLDDLADGSPNNTNDLVTWAWEVLMFKSLALATKYLIEDARAAIWEAEATRLENNLVREHSREKSVHRRPITNEPG